ncbi:MAG: gamma-glutamyl-gamma-aminobutyrate hydrolase family protein [Cohaesibacter sp.]|jgi:GMP synthase-like glutamine amidotransferase|nr:gamma-glutamyl-gamma-aminobutyrate hydrolase family protein [Cohaesibacter sp.]
MIETSYPFTIGILEAGLVPDELRADYGSYPAMFEALLEQNAPTDWAFETFSPVEGHFPTSVKQCDAWLVTGSKFSAYEDLDWIHHLRDFLSHAYSADVPIVGICFGHQILAEALGGKVAKADQGWGCGAHRYKWIEKPDWMEKADPQARQNGSFVVQSYHQDQVIVLPQEAKVLAQSDFCPYAALSYEDKAMSFQGHPEFSANYASDLFALRRENGLPAHIADAAIATKNTPIDQDLMARGIVEFLEAFQTNK